MTKNVRLGQIEAAEGETAYVVLVDGAAVGTVYRRDRKWHLWRLDDALGERIETFRTRSEALTWIKHTI